MQIEIADGTITVDAAFVGGLLKVPPDEVPALMRARAITSLCERGVNEHAGGYRLSFFYRNRRARFSVDATGKVIQRSVIDFGEVALPRELHRPG